MVCQAGYHFDVDVLLTQDPGKLCQCVGAPKMGKDVKVTLV